MMQRSDLFTGGLFVALGVFLVIASLPLRPPPHVPYGPGFFPTIVGIGMMFFGGLVCWGGLRRRAHSKTAAPVPDGLLVSRLAVRPVTAVTAFVVAPILFILLVPILGFLIAMPLIMGTLIWLLRRRWISSYIVAIVLTLTLQTMFQEVMRVPLPWGILEPWAGVLTWM